MGSESLGLRLFAWGANSYGQLGIGERSEQSETPTELARPPPDVETLAGGGGHSLAVGAGGELYSCGWNSKGQLGLGDAEDRAEFARVGDAPRVRAAAAGWDFTVIVGEDGRAYGAGSNAFGQLGLGSKRRGADKFSEIEAVSEVRAVACGLRHTVFLDGGGSVFGCGSAKKGQLGVEGGKGTGDRFTPVKMSIPSPVRQICAGQHFTLALTLDGKIFGFGDNKRGQLQGSLEDPAASGPFVLNIDRLTDSPVAMLEVGWTHAACLFEDGRVATWGRNDYHQLGRPDSARAVDFVPGPKRVSLSSGSEHCVAKDENGDRLVSWGWNEHGNCGDGFTRNVADPTLVKLPETAQIVSHFSASAHNFALVKMGPIHAHSDPV